MTPSASPPNTMFAAPTRRRFVHLWFPRLSTDRTRGSTLGPRLDGRPRVQVDTVKSALRVTAVDEAAAAEGLGVGMTLGDARAQVPNVRVARADAAGDLALLGRLAEACRRYTPALALHPPQGVDLDVTGCTALFGGEAALLEAIDARFCAGFALRLALADTPGLAWAVARHGPGGVVTGVGEAALSSLPIAALGLDAEAAQVLDGLGLKRVGQVLALPRVALARRVGEAALHRLDAVLGRRADPLETRLEPSPLRAERRVFEPVADAAQVLQVVGDLAADLTEILARGGLGGRRFVLELFRVDGAVKRLQVAASRPLADPRRIADLFAERLAGLNEGLEADFGFDQFRLCALGVDTLSAEPRTLLAPPTQTERALGARALSDLADRLAARTGAQVLRPAPGDAHAPERADVTRPLSIPPPDWAAEPVPAFEGEPLRPMRLFTPPQPVEAVLFEAPEGAPVRFTWRRVARTVVRAEGPERLEPQWALQPDGRVRDYYRLEDDEGRRYWLFREGRHDAPDIPPPGRTPPEPTLEVIRPVRPEAAALRLIILERSPSLTAHPREGGDPDLLVAVRGPELDPRLRGDERLGEGEGLASPPQPRWFLHGLFG